MIGPGPGSDHAAALITAPDRPRALRLVPSSRGERIAMDLVDGQFTVDAVVARVSEEISLLEDRPTRGTVQKCPALRLVFVRLPISKRSVTRPQRSSMAS